MPAKSRKSAVACYDHVFLLATLPIRTFRSGRPTFVRLSEHVRSTRAGMCTMNYFTLKSLGVAFTSISAHCIAHRVCVPLNSCVVKCGSDTTLVNLCVQSTSGESFIHNHIMRFTSMNSSLEIYVASQHEELKSRRDERRKSAEKRKKAEKVFTEWNQTKAEEEQLKKKQSRLTAEQLAAAEVEVLGIMITNSFFLVLHCRSKRQLLKKQSRNTNSGTIRNKQRNKYGSKKKLKRESLRF